MRRAFTRAVSPKLADCELTHLERMPIDVGKASAQHSAYEAALQQAGFDIIRLPELPDHPDGVFVEDTALLLDGHAIILRPGAASRAAETASTAAGLADHFELHHVRDGHVDGGDVLRIDTALYVGVSTRTDLAGITALRETVRPLGFGVIQARLSACLHLKSGATLAGYDREGNLVLLYDQGSVDPAQFDGVAPVPVSPREPAAANCLWLGDRVILPAGNSRTAEQLRNRGFHVLEIDVSELQKAESGVTCMSLIAG